MPHLRLGRHRRPLPTASAASFSCPSFMLRRACCRPNPNLSQPYPSHLQRPSTVTSAGTWATAGTSG